MCECAILKGKRMRVLRVCVRVCASLQIQENRIIRMRSVIICTTKRYKLESEEFAEEASHGENIIWALLLSKGALCRNLDLHIKSMCV